MHARAAETEVVVRYERTSLSPESDALVTQMAAQDRGESPVWARQVNTYLATTDLGACRNQGRSPQPPRAQARRPAMSR
jgi:hypothetical protein